MHSVFEKNYSLATLDCFNKTEPIMFSKRNLSKDRTVPVHWHNYLELEIIATGTAKHIVTGSNYTLSKGSAYIMTGCDFHTIIPKSDITLLNLSVTSGVIEENLEKYVMGSGSKFHCCFTDDELSYITTLFEKAQNESGGNYFSDLIKKNIAEEIIISLIRASGVDTVVSHPPLVQQAIITVNERFLNHLTLKDVAEELYVSPNYLGLLFKNKVGVSFNTYLTMTRLRYASMLLNTTNKTVNEIAMLSGFSSTEYFLSRFKKIMNCTPKEYKKISENIQN